MDKPSPTHPRYYPLLISLIHMLMLGVSWLDLIGLGKLYLLLLLMRYCHQRGFRKRRKNWFIFKSEIQTCMPTSFLFLCKYICFLYHLSVVMICSAICYVFFVFMASLLYSKLQKKKKKTLCSFLFLCKYICFITTFIQQTSVYVSPLILKR